MICFNLKIELNLEDLVFWKTLLARRSDIRRNNFQERKNNESKRQRSDVSKIPQPQKCPTTKIPQPQKYHYKIPNNFWRLEILSETVCILRISSSRSTKWCRFKIFQFCSFENIEILKFSKITLFLKLQEN